MTAQCLPTAFSPCPNDTFIFHAWVEGLLDTDVVINPILADVQTLNEWALQGKYPVSKVSMGVLPYILEKYTLLPTGGALGRGCGPKIIAREPLSLDELTGKEIAVPGMHTTAHLLLQLLLDTPLKKRFCKYHEIAPLLKAKTVDCGLIIHESRFTFAKEGFFEVADLGELWEARFNLPLPLGGVVAKKELGLRVLDQLAHNLMTSVMHAQQRPNLSQSFILKHSQEKALDVIQAHIDLYVNQETVQLSDQGIESIATLFSLALEKQLIPKTYGAYEINHLLNSQRG